MKCSDVQEQLLQLPADRLPSTLAAHLAACMVCSQVWASWREVSRDLQHLQVDSDPLGSPPGMADAIMAQVLAAPAPAAIPSARGVPRAEPGPAAPGRVAVPMSVLVAVLGLAAGTVAATFVVAIGWAHPALLIAWLRTAAVAGATLAGWVMELGMAAYWMATGVAKLVEVAPWIVLPAATLALGLSRLLLRGRLV